MGKLACAEMTTSLLTCKMAMEDSAWWSISLLPSHSLDMGIIEEIQDASAPQVVAPSKAAPTSAPPSSASNPAELTLVLRSLSSKLALPEDLLPSFMNEDKRELLMHRNEADMQRKSWLRSIVRKLHRLCVTLPLGPSRQPGRRRRSTTRRR